MATVSNTQERTGEEKFVALGDIGTENIPGWDPTKGVFMGDNGTHTERKRGVLGYWACRGDAEGMCSSAELLGEAGCCLAQLHARVQSGTGNEGSHTGGEAGSNSILDSTRDSLPSFFIHPQGI